MDFIELFKRQLASQSSSASKNTVKNYIADVRHFISWYENTMKSIFEAKLINADIIRLYEKSMGGIVENGRIRIETKLSTASTKRHLSSLRKFFSLLEKNNYIEKNPFSSIEPETTIEATDYWHLRSFADYLILGKASKITVKNYVSDIQSFAKWYEQAILPGLDNPLVAAGGFYLITQSVLNDYKNRLSQIQNAAPRTINRKLSALRRYLDFASKKGFIRSDELTVDPYRVSEQKSLITESSISLKDIDEVRKTEKHTYSAFPPVRLAQRLFIFPYLGFEEKAAGIIAGIIAGKSADGLQKLPSRVAREIANKNLLRSKRLGVSSILGVGNVSKEFYEPNKVSLLGQPLHKRVIFHARFTRPNWYKKYHDVAFVHYAHFALLVIFASGVGVALYQNLVVKKQTPTFAAATAPPRILSFQGRLTDNLDNPITTARQIRFMIYDNISSSGSAVLWEELRTVSPDQDGIFSVLLGSDANGANAASCGAFPLGSPATGACLIPTTVFSDNSQTWLGVTVESTSELSPRQKIATVAYATNAEFLQGLPPTTQAGLTSYANVVLALDSAGNLTLSDSSPTNHTFQVSNGSFRLLGQSLLLSTNNGTGGNVTISPDGLGKINLEKGLVNTTSMGNIVSGGVEVNDRFGVLATESAVAAFIVNNNTTGGDILTASSSGTTRFTIANDGTITDTLYTTAGGILFAASGGVFTQTAVGANGECLKSTAGGTPTFGTCGGANYWNLASGTLYPINETLDLLVGGNTTESANFRFLNNSAGTPVASVSANSGNNAAFIAGDGTFGTTNRQSLTIGNSSTYNTTGNILFNSNGIGKIGVYTNNPITSFDVRGISGTESAASISANTSFAAVVINNLGSGDFLTASKGGHTYFRMNSTHSTYAGTPYEGEFIVGKDGNGKLTALVLDPVIVSNQKTTGTTSLTLHTSGASNADILFVNQSTELSRFNQSGQLQLPITGSNAGITLGGDTQLFRGATDRIDIAANDSINFLSGTGGLMTNGVVRIDTSGNGTFTNVNVTGTCTGCVSANNSPFQILQGAIVPLITSTDFLIGAQATGSAKFAVLNINNGTPTASVSSGLDGNGISIDANGNIQTEKNQTLTLGGSRTGNISLAENVAITGDLTVSGAGTHSFTGTLDPTNVAAFTLTGAVSGNNQNISSIGTITANSSLNQVTGFGVMGSNGVTAFEGITLNVSTDATVAGGDITGANGAIIDIGEANSGDFTFNGDIILPEDGFIGLSSSTPRFVFDSTPTPDEIDLQSGNLDLNTNLVLNIGDNETDFTSGGGLNIQGTLQLNTLTSNGGILYTNGSGQVAQATAGTTDQCLKGGTTPTFGNCVTIVSPFEVENGAIVPSNITLDFLVGSRATNSAKFAVLNINSGNPTASVSSGLSGTGAYFDTTGSFQTVNKGTLTIGGTNTGNVVIDSGSSLITLSDNTAFSQNVTIGGSTGITFSTTGGVNLAGGTLSDTSDGVDISDALEVSGLITADGGITVSSGQTTTFASFTSNGGIFYGNGSGVLQQVTAGLPDQCLLGGTTPSFGSCTNATNSPFETLAGAIIQRNTTTDLLIGSQSTNSAKFAVLNINSGTPTASVSSGLSGTGSYFDSNGIFSTVNKGSLTLGGSNTGNILIDSGSELVTISDSTTISQNLTIGGTTGITFSTTGGINLAGGTLSDSSDGVDINDALEVSGLITADGGITVASGQTTTLASFTSNGGLLYTNGSGVVAQVTAGGSGQCLLGGTTPAFGSCTNSSNSPFQVLTGAIVPHNATLDFIIGAQSTTSAKFAVLNIDSGTPTASVSAQDANNQALVLAGDGSIQSVRNNTLTIGGSTTGNIIIDSASNVITLADSTTISQNLTIGGTTGITFSTTGGVNLAGGTLSDTSDGVDINDDLDVSGSINLSTGNLAFSSTGGITLADGTLSDSVDGVDIADALEVSGLITANGGLTVPSGQTTTFANFTSNGGIFYGNGSGVLQQVTAGAATQCLLGGTTPTFGSCATGGTDSPFQVLTGAIIQNNITLDFLLGAQSTASAKFAVLNINSGTPTASVSAQDVNNQALVLAGDGSIQSVRNNTLTIGGSTTGNIIIDSASGLITLSDSTTITGNLTVNGAGTHAFSGTLDPSSVAAFTLAGTITGGNQNISAIGDITANSGSNVITGFGTIGTNGTTAFQGLSLTISGDATISGGDITGANSAVLDIGEANSGDFTFNADIILPEDGFIGLSGSLPRLVFDTSTTPDEIDVLSANLDLNDNLILNIGNSATDFTSGGGLNIQGTLQLNTLTSNGGILYTNGTGQVTQIAAGGGTQCLLGGTTPTWGSCSTGGTDSPFQILTGAISQNNTTLDFLLGGIATNSSKFSVLGLNTDNPTASVSAVSGSNSGNGVTLGSDGSIQSLRNNTLTIGGSTTGNIIFNPTADSRVGINTTTPLASFDIRSASGILGGGTLSIASVSGRTSFAGLTVDNSLGDIFTASSSGQHRFVIKNSGFVGIGTATASARLAFAVSNNAEGGIKFGDDANLYRSGTSTLASINNFFVGSTTNDISTAPTVADDVIVDNANFMGISAPRLGSDGFLRIAYVDESLETLKYAQCTNADCSTNVLTTVDNGAFVESPTLTLASDGFGRMVYSDSNNGALSFVQCTNASCSTKNRTTINISNAEVNTPFVVGADGFARIIFTDQVTGDLTFLQCTNAACTATASAVLDSGNYSSVGVPYALGGDGFMRLMYTDQGSGDMNFVQCTNASCSTRNTTAITSGNFEGADHFAIASDGFGRFIYQDQGSGDLNFVQCTNASCSTRNTNAIDTGDFSDYNAMVFGSDNFARILYQDDGTAEIKFVQCTNASCSTNNTNVIASSTSNGVYLTLDSDGNPFIVYQDGVSGAFKGIHCLDASCSSLGEFTTIGLVSYNPEYNHAFLGNDGAVKFIYTDSTNEYLHAVSLSVAEFIPDNNDLYVAGTFGVNSDIFADGSLYLAGGINSAGNIETSGNLTINGGTSLESLTVNGNSTFNGSVLINSSLNTNSVYAGSYQNYNFSNNGGVVYTNGSGLFAQTSAGSAGQCLQSIGGGAPTWGTCGGGTSPFTSGSGAIYATNTTQDFLVGGTSTSSARFSVTNLNGPAGSINSWANTTDTGLSGQLEQFGLVYLNGYVYHVGGYDGPTVLDTVRYARVKNDGTLDTWVTSPNTLPEARLWHGTVTVNGYIYVVGGHSSVATPTNPAVYYAKVNADGTVGTWSSTTSIPSPRIRLTHSVASANGYIYVIGGENSSAQTTVWYAKVNADGTLGSWVSGTSLPVATSDQAVVIDNGYIYSMGGLAPSATNTIYYAKINYDGSIGAWIGNPNNLASADSMHSAIAVNGYVYVLGGINNSTTVYYAKFNSDGTIPSFSTNAASLPESHQGSGITYGNGYIYISGGFGTDNVAYGSIARVSIAGNLDLLGLTSTSIASSSGLAGGGSIFAGNIFAKNLEVGGSGTIWGNLSVSNTLSSSSLSVSGRVSGKALTIFNETGNQDIFSASSSGVTRFTIGNDGKVNIGTAQGPTGSLNNFTAKLNVYSNFGTVPAASISANTSAPSLLVNQDGSGDLLVASYAGMPKFRLFRDLNDDVEITLTIGENGVGKVNALDYDPPYTIDGKRYSTFAPSTFLPTEEYTGKAVLSYDASEGAYVQKLDFNNFEYQSDLWVFNRIVDPDVSLVKVFVTPNSSARTWYKKDGFNRTITLYSDRPTEVSFRLTSYRVDHKKYATYNPNGVQGLVVPPPPNPNGDSSNDNNFSADPYFDSLTINEQNGKWVLRDNNGNSINHIEAFSKLIIANIQAGYINAQKIVVGSFESSTAWIGNLSGNTLSFVQGSFSSITSTVSSLGSATASSLAITTNSVSIAGQSLSSYIESVVDDYLGGQLLSPLAEAPNIKTDVISPLTDTSSPSLEFGNSKLGVRGTSGTVAWFDNQGNASFSGQLTADSASISGTLAANSASFQSSDSRLITSETATVSGTLRTNNLIANNIEGLDQKLATIAAAINNGSPIVSTGSGEFSSVYANLVNAGTLTADFGIFEQGITSMGPITATDITAMDTLSVGTSMIFTNNSINTINAELAIQSFRQADITFQGGLIRMDTDGNMEIAGNLNVVGEIDAVFGVFSGTLATPALAVGMISPLAGDDLTIRLTEDSSSNSGRLKVANHQGKEVLSVNSKGDIFASGAATLSKLNFNLVGEAQASSLTEATASGSAGFATLKAGQPEITIKNPNVTSKSLIYITPFGNTNNKVLYLLRQVPHSEEEDGSFTVGLSGPTVPQNIQFNWLIVN